MSKVKALLITGAVLTGITVFLFAMFFPLGLLCAFSGDRECNILLTVPALLGAIAMISLCSSGVLYLLSKGKRTTALLVALITFLAILYFLKLYVIR